MKLADLDDFSGLRGIGILSSGLVPGPGILRTEEYYFLEHMKQTEEVVESMNSGWSV